MKEIYERCVCCHKRLNISVNEEIEYRAFYIQGAGQLCYDCYHEIYNKGTECGAFEEGINKKL